MQANNGTGSTIIFDATFAHLPCGVSCFRNYVHTDILLGMWIFFVGSTLLVPYVRASGQGISC
jgi:hypothetical protein